MLSCLSSIQANTKELSQLVHGQIQRGEGTGGLDLAGKSQVAIGFLKNSGTYLPREAIWFPWVRGQIAFQWRSIGPSVKYVDMTNKKVVRTTPLTEFSGSAQVVTCKLFHMSQHQ